MKSKEPKLAKERILILLDEAEASLKKGNKEKSRRYVSIAKAISTKNKVPLGRLKKNFCKKCGIYFIPGKTLRVRTQKKDKRVVYTCLECGNIQRYRYVREKKKL